MKVLAVIIIIFSLSVEAKIMSDMSLTLGRHVPETFILRKYKTSRAEGYGFAKVIGKSKMRFQRLDKKDYQKRLHQMTQIVQTLKKNQRSPSQACFSQVKVMTAQRRGPASLKFYCLDNLPQKKRIRVVNWWKTGQFN